MPTSAAFRQKWVLPAAAHVIQLHMSSAPMLVFDGECRFCNRSVRFVLAHERRSDLLFVPRQSPFGIGLRRQYHLEGVESLLWIENGHAYVEFEAVARTAAYVGGIYGRLASIACLFPRALLNRAYRVFTRIRKRVTGRASQCPLLTPSQQKRFLESAPEVPGSADSRVSK